MNNKVTYKCLIGGSLALALVALSLIPAGRVGLVGPAILGCLILLAIGVRGFEAVRRFSYTVWILAAVAASMFYPHCFTAVGSFEPGILIAPLLQVAMFGIGSKMSPKDFAGIVRMPRSLIIGVCAQFMIMPLAAFAISQAFIFPPGIAMGVILIGCVPGGPASNVMSYIARANLPLSVAIGLIATLLSPVLTPALMRLLAGQYIAIDVWGMMLYSLNMIVLPIVAGFIFNLFYSARDVAGSKAIQLGTYFVIIALTCLAEMVSDGCGIAGFLLSLLKSACWFCFGPIVFSVIMRIIFRGDRRITDSFLSFLPMAGIALIITIVTATVRDSLLSVGALLLLTGLFLNSAGYALGYTVAWLFRAPEKDRRAIALAVGMQNAGLATQIGKAAAAGVASAVFGPLMNITGSALAGWWRRKGRREPAVF
ncbi:MAG: bile acid:sodium symporter family protein [Tannerellaceae bacterium]|nr:bile acid:sodium symporter family protein [Tannerellaceae bacterium]